MPSVHLRVRGGNARYVDDHPTSNRIMTIAEWCEVSSISKVTGWRILRSGYGPTVTRLSARRIGIREDHHAAWLDSLATR